MRHAELLLILLVQQPRQAAAAGADAFVCDGRALPPALLDDDYCDCSDGSDEPGTSACAGVGSIEKGSKSKGLATFRCANKPHQPSFIYASRVGDGVCDCCDGSDELATPGMCENT
eukprot:2170177-Pleurochrysis_carterae.AAC.4